MGLHLDALCDVVNILNDCGWHVEQRSTQHINDSSCLKTELMGRIELVIQLPFLLLQTAVGQTLRGLSSLVAGILVLDEDRIKFGIIDIVSVIVQILALPVISFLGLLTPRWAGDLTHNICKQLSDYENYKHFGTFNNKTMITQYSNYSTMEYDPETRNMIACGLMSLVEIPAGLTLALFKTISYTLTGSIFNDEDRRTLLSRIAKGSFLAFPSLFTITEPGECTEIYGKVADHRAFSFRTFTPSNMNLDPENSIPTADFF